MYIIIVLISVTHPSTNRTQSSLTFMIGAPLVEKMSQTLSTQDSIFPYIKETAAWLRFSTNESGITKVKHD